VVTALVVMIVFAGNQSVFELVVRAFGRPVATGVGGDDSEVYRAPERRLSNQTALRFSPARRYVF
jgi:hypothetical protein